MPETQFEWTNSKLTWPQTIGIDTLVVGTALIVNSLLKENPSTVQEFLNNKDNILGISWIVIGGWVLLASRVRDELSWIVSAVGSAMHE